MTEKTVSELTGSRGLIRVEMLQNAMLVSIPVALLFAVLDMTVGTVALGWVEAMTATVMGSLLLSTYKKPDMVDFTAQMVVLCAAAIFFTVLMTGGFTDQGFIWSVGFPFVACFLIGARRGAACIVAYAMAMLLVMLFDWHAYGIETYTLPEAGYIATAYIMFSFLAYLMNVAHERSMLENLRLRVAMEQVPDAVSIADVNDHVVFSNVAYDACYGPHRQRVVAGMTGDGESLSAVVKAALGRGGTWKGELEVSTQQGLRMMRRVVSTVSDGGEIGYYVYMDHDVTDERLQQQQLEHSQRLESLGILAGGIAHDFNNILTAIMGNAGMAMRQADDAVEVKKLLGSIEAASARAAELCMQMLAYSGRGKFVVKMINISDMVRDMARLMEVSIDKNIHIQYRIQQGLPSVEVDVAQMQQVILNLITNANEAIGDQGGDITFSTGVMQADDQYLSASILPEKVAAGAYVYLEVSDSGCGMDSDTMEKLFDPFFTTKFTGRGLGMSMVLGIIRSHQGALRVDSEPGQGSSFRVLLPVQEGAEAAEVVPAVAVERDGQINATVLLVDDEQSIREVATRMLKYIGMHVLSADDGHSALEVYRHHMADIDLVLLDMTMPRMDGGACLTELLCINPAVKVIICSGYSEDEVSGRNTLHGQAGFIQKPYTLCSLQQAITQLL